MRGTCWGPGRARSPWRRWLAVSVIASSSVVLTFAAGVAPSSADTGPATSGVSPTPQPTVTAPPPKPACFDTTGDGNPDSDGDGLCDNWETQGIDGDGDGVVDLKLYDDNRDGKISASEVPDPNVPDVYVELDYMKGLKPLDRSIQYVIGQFAAAPRPIRLHVVVNDQIPFSANTRFVDCVAMACPQGTSGFFDTKDTYFGARAERIAKTWPAVRVAKTYVFHYALWVNHFTYEDGTGGYSGAGETDGNDFLIALGDWGATRGGTANQQAATFMHELGHNLGLHHGGGDDVNCKPNYLEHHELPVPDAGHVRDEPPDRLLALGLLARRVGARRDRRRPGRHRVDGRLRSREPAHRPDGRSHRLERQRRHRPRAGDRRHQPDRRHLHGRRLAAQRL